MRDNRLGCQHRCLDMSSSSLSLYISREGETLADIATLHRLRLEDLQPVNTLHNALGDKKACSGATRGSILLPTAFSNTPASLRPGTKVWIPNVPAELLETGKYHIVGPGERLPDIARTHNVSLQDLEKWNSHIRDGLALPGEVIYLCARTE
jgi:hypothetical protein